jgi:hypothetical protein
VVGGALVLASILIVCVACSKHKHNKEKKKKEYGDISLQPSYTASKV